MASPSNVPQTEAELRTALGPEAPAAPAPEPPKEVKLATGQVYRGTPEEIIESLVKSQEEASRTIKELRSLHDSLQPKEPPPPKASPTFSNDKFYEKMGQDPLGGIKMALSELMGVEEDLVPVALKASIKTMHDLNDHLETQKFLMKYKDAPSDKEFTDAMVEILNEEGLPWNASSLEHAYLRLEHEGKTRREPAAPETPKPAPTLSGSGAMDATAMTVADETAKAYTMKLSDLEKLLRERGMM